MAVKTYAELHEQIKNLLKGNDTDEAITLLEDLQDSANSIGAGKKYQYDDDMEAKLEEVEKTWKQKYIDRFYSSEIDETAVKPVEPKLEEPPKEETIQIKDLFKEVKK